MQDCGCRRCTAATSARMTSIYRRLYADSSWRRPSASLCTVSRGPLSHTRAFLARPSPLQLNTVAGELLGLLPTLRHQHVALRLWLERDHPSNLSVVPDGLRPEWNGARARDARAFVSYLQQELGVMLELPAVAQRAASLRL